MPGGMRTARAPSAPSSTQSSCIITVSGPSPSAPAGIGAPVKMRTAVPRACARADRVAGRGAAGRQRQTRLALGREVVEIDRVAVDRRIVVRRHVARGDQVVGQDAVERRAERHRLALGDGDDARVEQAPSASAAVISRPPKAKQSSLSWAMAR